MGFDIFLMFNYIHASYKKICMREQNWAQICESFHHNKILERTSSVIFLMEIHLGSILYESILFKIRGKYSEEKNFVEVVTSWTGLDQ